MSVGEKARKLRLQHGYTLKEVHQRTGISMSHLSAIENGTRPNPSFQNIEKLAEVYGVPVCYFAESGPCPRHALQMADNSRSGQADMDDNLVYKERSNAAPNASQAPACGPKDDSESRYDWPDDEVRSFIASERSRPYLALARKLMAADPLHEDTPELLHVIAEFIREQKQSFRDDQ
jgi:transcriptional regulator with XRE-family HTH domain